MRALPLVCALAACGPRLPVGFEDVVIDPEASYTRTPPEDLVAWAGGQAATNQLLVRLDEGDEATIDAVTDALDAEVVGRVPAIDLYQLSLDAPDAAALDAARAHASGLDGVVGAFPNARHRQAAGVDACEGDGDNDPLEGPARCAFEDIDAYGAALVWGAVVDGLTLSRVRVAVLDTGVGVGSGQFDDVDVLFLADPFASANDGDGHGTRVAGLIAADDHDGGTAGLATTLIGNKLQLLAGGSDETAMGDLFEILFAVEGARADVVNLSWGFEFDEIHGGEGDEVQATFDRVFTGWPDTLFVLAAGNEGLEVTGMRAVPQQSSAPNVAVVGGLAACDPTQAASFSNFGDRVDLAAPAERVPVLAYDPLGGDASGPPVLQSGTSFAAPMVSAAAAVVRSVAPGYSAEQTLDALVRWGFDAPATVGGIRLATSSTYGRVLLAEQPAVAAPRIDVDEPHGEPDVPALVGARLCRTALLTVEGWGSWTFEAEDDPGASLLTDDLFDLGLGSEAEEISWIALVQEKPFELGTDWAFPTPAACTFADGGPTALGVAVSGALRFVRCTITERYPFADDTPAALELEFRADGVFEITDYPELIVSSHAFQAQGVLPTAVFGQGEELVEAIEELCSGGYGE